MWRLILLGFVSLLAETAWADEVSAMPAASVSGETVAQPASPDQASSTTLPPIVIPEPPTQAKADCPPPPPSPETDADRLRKQQAQTAPLEIEAFRRTVKDTARSVGFLASLFTSAKQPIDDELLADMDRFIAHHSDLPETAEVYKLKAQVHGRMEAYSASAMDWLMLIAGYPDSPLAGEAAKRLNELGKDQLKKQAAAVSTLVQKTKSLQGDHDHRVSTYLADIGTTVNDANFAAPIASECALFLQSNRAVLEEDAIEHALAHQSMLIDNQIAIYHFNKLLTLYASSPLRPDSLLSIGDVQRNGLKLYDQATQSYSKLIAQYPEAKETKVGYQSLANMYEMDMKDYPNAIKTYEAIIAKYKDDPAALQSLRAMALIYNTKANQPDKAIETYIRLSEMFKNNDGLMALNNAEEIATAIHDWKSAMNINGRIIALSPKTDSAAKAAFANAEIAEQDLKDREQARKLYSDVVDNYPGHALAQEAQKRISAIDSRK